MRLLQGKHHGPILTVRHAKLLAHTSPGTPHAHNHQRHAWSGTPLSELETRRLDPSTDQGDLVDLFELVFGHTILPGMWEWKHQPEWAPRHECWVARYDDRIVGYVGAVCVRGVVDGKAVPFFQLSDVMVHPQYRRKFDYFDLAAKHIFEDVVAHNEDRIIYGFSNHRAFLWFKKLGLSDIVEKARICTVPPQDVGAGTPFEIKEASWQDPWLDEFWAEHIATVRLGLVRDGAYLVWRYGRHPVYPYKLRRIEEGGRAIGWVVLGAHGGKPEMPVVDMLLPPGREPEVLQALANHLNRPVRFWLASNRTPPFADEKESKTSVYIFLKPTTVGIEQLRNDLYYTMGDADWW
jgi:GNAT superfamily N-acetyltransferase